MTKTSIAEVSTKLFELLSPLEAEDRAKVVTAALVLLGDEPLQFGQAPGGSASGNQAGQHDEAPPADPAAFFATKEPKNKGEMLAVAARYRELHGGGETHSKQELREVVTNARRNFDSHNFSRDINNARNQAGLFNKGTGRNSYQLSYYGQQYVDALPDREAAGKLTKPKGAGRKRTAKKKAKKKPAKKSGS